MKAPHPELADEQIKLSDWAGADAAARRRLLADPECAAWLPVAGERPAPGERPAADDILVLAIIDARTGNVLGGIELVPRPHGRGEIAYALAREARGRGVATRAVRLLSRWALRTHGLARLELPTPVDHLAAVRVAARAGYYREGVLRSYLELRGTRVDIAMWALLRSDLPPHS
jgi:RimJ/RimL family protein N-acetyltransferase